jgi:hypothetical protein
LPRFSAEQELTLYDFGLQRYRFEPCRVQIKSSSRLASAFQVGKSPLFMGLGHSKVTLKSTQALLLFHQSKRSLDQVLDVLAPSDFFPCRT